VSQPSRRRTRAHLLAQPVRTLLDDRRRRRTKSLVDEPRQAADEQLVGRPDLVAHAAIGDEAVHHCQELASVHNQPLEIRHGQLTREVVERPARHQLLDRELQQLAAVVHVLDAELSRSTRSTSRPQIDRTTASMSGQGVVGIT
jgi:hypothetical protein